MIDCSNPPSITICPGVADIKILASELGKCCGDPNEDSLVLQLVVNGKPAALFVGDLEGSAVQDLIQSVALKGCSLRSEILRLAHHGSTKKNANSEDFLDAVSPTVAFSSSDPGHKSFRHPHCSAMKWFDSTYVEQEDIKHPYICNGNTYNTKLKHHLYQTTVMNRYGKNIRHYILDLKVTRKGIPLMPVLIKYEKGSSEPTITQLT